MILQKRSFNFKPVLVALSSSLLLAACSKPAPPVVADEPLTVDSQQPATNVNLWPQLNLPVVKDPAIEQAITDLMAGMTLPQKVAQMIQPEIRDITVDDMRQYGFGSYLNGGGAFPNDDKYATPADWIALAEAMYQASVDSSLDGSSIPTMWGTDAVHGHNNVIGATIFPHNIGLGAANNPALIEQIAKVTAREVMVTGIDWVFAPTVAVVRDDRWGRTYEGYSEHPQIVHDYAAAIVKGLQGAADGDFLGDDKVISTVKHFVGDGGTTGGIDQGNTEVTEQQLFDIHAQGYVGGLQAGAQSVMASFNSWNGSKIHGDKYLLTDVLKDRMGFDGFVVGDWNGHGQIPGCSNENCPQAANAGLDIYMVPTAAWKPLYHNLIAQVEAGDISMQRVDDAVRRILRVKMRAGLFDKASPAKRPLAGKTELIGAEQHRAIARDAVRQSLVLLKNHNQLLPLNPTQRLLVTGGGADNIGQQAGGWTISWQGTGNTNADFPGGSSIYDGIARQVKAAGGSVELSADGSYQQKPDVAIVVFGEEPYAEGNGDLDNLEYQRGNKTDLALLKKLKAEGIPVVSLFISGRPLWVNPELNASDAFVAVWLPGSEGEGVADVILANADGTVQYDFHGKLSFSWPASPQQTAVNYGDADYQPLLPYGFGLRYGDKDVLTGELSEQIEQNTQLTEMAIFERSPRSPWQLQLQSGNQSEMVGSSIQQLGAVNSRTFDKEVQEDARRFEFDGSASAAFSFISPFPRDLRAYAEADSQLTVLVKRQGEVPATVMLGMACGEDCGGRVNISEALAAMPDDQWQPLAVNLSCLQQQGMNLGQVFQVLSVQSSGKLTLNLADARISPVANQQHTVVACK
ncbi:glycoside hydrolase family 3 N-terminal domain-containing protein [Arsukibacterium indicum]|uniref:Glycoside hydrolase family 3 C-terminal domain-containing protein n=1 Tax=Arsukibacterium indicum TaxID=2848612 RepID=A0ABS6MNC0_9GAMM|nr:glycoside hydrolase family 3 N-terminal domain-containing protein [Arsukibacterium indicum]MBV2130314.1 glycoside hydrolase family 3 C-terminal domain-containing protein [Arsukibacterium indicum]